MYASITLMSLCEMADWGRKCCLKWQGRQKVWATESSVLLQNKSTCQNVICLGTAGSFCTSVPSIKNRLIICDNV